MIKFYKENLQSLKCSTNQLINEFQLIKILPGGAELQHENASQNTNVQKLRVMLQTTVVTKNKRREF